MIQSRDAMGKDAAKPTDKDKTKVMDAMPSDVEALRQRLIALGLDPNAAQKMMPGAPPGSVAPPTGGNPVEPRLQRAANGTVMGVLPGSVAPPANPANRAPASVAPPAADPRPGTTKLVRSNVLAPLQQGPGNQRHPGSAPNQQVPHPQGAAFRPSGQPGSAPNQAVAPPMMPHPGSVPPPGMGSVAPPGMGRPMPQSVMPPMGGPPLKPCNPTNDPRLVLLLDPNGTQASGFRILRDTLFSKGLPKVLAISSAEEGEGKTTCAMNLAIAIAEQRQGPAGKILLVDGNFANPTLAGLLGIDTSTPATAGPFILAALTPTLHIASVPSAQSYVDFSTLARLFDSFHRAGYQHIILDTPPIEGSPEGNLLLNLAGGVLLVTRAGQSTTAAFKKAVERIGDKALGVALMDAPVAT